MKPIFDFGRLDGWQPGAGVLCLALALVAGGGCGKSQSSAVSSPATNSTPAPTAPATTPTATSAAAPIAMPTATTPTNGMGPMIPSTSPHAGLTQLQLLNRALVGWEITNHRRPQNFDEFASTANIQIPAPPPGKKYELPPSGFIILVNANQ